MTERPISTEINFHDSFLLKVEVSNTVAFAAFTVYAPDALGLGRPRIYRLRFDGLLRLEFETRGYGDPNYPIEIYGIFEETDEEYHRWRERLDVLRDFDDPAWGTGAKREELHHVLLASSLHAGFEDALFRTWAENFAGGISANPALYMLTAANATSIQSVVDEFVAALTLSSQ